MSPSIGVPSCHSCASAGASHLSSACIGAGRCVRWRFGAPITPITVAKNASSTSTDVIDTGDSCAFFAASERSSPENTRKYRRHM